MADPCGFIKWRLLVQLEIAHPPHPECLRALVGYQILQSTKNFTECGVLPRVAALGSGYSAIERSVHEFVFDAVLAALKQGADRIRLVLS